MVAWSGMVFPKMLHAIVSVITLNNTLSPFSLPNSVHALCPIEQQSATSSLDFYRSFCCRCPSLAVAPQHSPAAPAFPPPTPTGLGRGKQRRRRLSNFEFYRRGGQVKESNETPVWESVPCSFKLHREQREREQERARERVYSLFLSDEDDTGGE